MEKQAARFVLRDVATNLSLPAQDAALRPEALQAEAVRAEDWASGKRLAFLGSE